MPTNGKTPPENRDGTGTKRPTPFSIGSICTTDLHFPASNPIRHAFTIDVEDWQQSVLDRELPVSERFVPMTERFLALLARHHTKATFFVLGNVAQKAPDLIRRIDAAGHEVQTHGYDHTEVTRFTPGQFAEDVRRGKGIIEDIIAKPVTGFRAPRFSIGLNNLWALEVLESCGFTYDSSIFPMRIRGYGIKGWPDIPVRVTLPSGLSILEMPVAITRRGLLPALLRRPLPIGGGGYWRLLPCGVLRGALTHKQSDGRPFALYFHPHELDTDAFLHVPRRVPLHIRLHQSLGRSSMLRKLDRVLGDFRFGTIASILKPHIATDTEIAGRALSGTPSLARATLQPART